MNILKLYVLFICHVIINHPIFSQASTGGEIFFSNYSSLNVRVKVRVYDILGKEVFKAEEFKKSGSYELKFDGTNFASGMYFYSLETSGFKDTKKMVLLK